MNVLQHDQEELKKKERGILGFFVRKYRVAYIVGILIAVGGILSAILIPKESSPFIPYGMVSISTFYDGASAVDVDTLVTQVIENKVKNISGVKKMNSISRNSLSNIQLEFEPDENMVRALGDVRSKVDEAKVELPSEIDRDPVITEIDSSLQPFVSILLSGPYDTMTLRDYGERLKVALENIDGVAKVNIQGGAEREVVVDLDPVKLRNFGITSQAVMSAIRSSHRNTPIGELSINDLNYTLRFQGRHELVADIANLQITDVSRETGVSVVRVSDVASVYEKGDDDATVFRFGIQETKVVRDAVEISVLKKQSTNIFDVDAKLRKKINSYLESSLPGDLEVTYTDEMAELIKEDYDLVFDSVRSSVIIIALIILVFVGFLEGLVASLVIPLAFLGTIIILKITGSTLNFMTNFSMVLSLGILVDTTIVIVEGTHDYIKRGYSAHEAAILSVYEFSHPLISGALTTLAVFVPLISLPGILGKYLSYVPITVSIILIISLLISLLLIPSYAAKILEHHKQRKADLVNGKITGTRARIRERFFKRGALMRKYFNAFEKRLVTKYSNVVKVLLSKRKWRIGIIYLTIVLFFLSFLIPVKFELFPGGDAPYIQLNMQQPIGTTKKKTLLYAIPVEQILLDQPEVKLISTSVNDNTASMYIELLDKEIRENEGLRYSVELANDLKDVFAEIKESEIRVENISGGPPSDAPVAMRVIAVDNTMLDKAQHVVADFKEILKNIEGTSGIRDNIEITPGEIRFTIDRDKSFTQHVDPDMVPAMIRTAFTGSTAATITRDGRDIDVIVQFHEGDIDSLEGIEKIQITNTQGQNISFGQIVDYEMHYGLSTIRRVDNNIAFTVSSLLADDGNAGEITKEFYEQIESYPLPDGIQIANAGENEENVELFAALASGAAIAFLVMILILVIQFNSFLQPFIILGTLVFGMLGVNVGLFITNTPRSLAFILGIIALMGIVVNDAIILIDQINKNRERSLSQNSQNGIQGKEDLKEVIIKSGISRFKPIILTTLTTAAGVFPLVFVDQFWAGLSYTVIFGLCVASFMTLFVTPATYYQIEHEKAITFLPFFVGISALGGIGMIFMGKYLAMVILLIIAGLLGLWLKKVVYKLKIQN